MIKVTIFNEYAHERLKENVKEIYPDGIHSHLASFLSDSEVKVRTTTLFDENGDIVHECGLTEEVLNDTDVLIWWGHKNHNDVPDAVVERVVENVHNGMGAIFLHSAHHSKPFKALMGTTCNLRWRVGEKERMWNIKPGHPIMQGIGDYIDIPEEEMYGECFEIPTPEELLMISSFSSHEVFRSACTWQRVNGRVFYFQPGHEEYPTFYIPEIRKIIKNAVRWAKPSFRVDKLECEHFPKIEL